MCHNSDEIRIRCQRTVLVTSDSPANYQSFTDRRLTHLRHPAARICGRCDGSP
ncbi:hypothetical protein HMPREF9622_00535 [Cutibacterium modestum HL037PA3]|uniref:Uncharacterized protein n=1 Tax=Cutibacterium modestum HL044PA1 TaxID=765109 RepID=A0ABP2KC42_9ACTN|nr:hypothetical protein HMPREF9621_01174 [Cutibacterium modestum HL037PA2]EFS93635.1 hypothetical protein HMPREF9607_00089 [Cutibacterium modestum HL044PA1]EFT16330.1 hypothetical protein HMPREF9622_00535 [Cutibacterium modestum HL037PA3]